VLAAFAVAPARITANEYRQTDERIAKRFDLDLHFVNCARDGSINLIGFSVYG
jgi:hypothetical protein